MGISYVNSYSFNGHMLCPFILISVGIDQSLWAFLIIMEGNLPKKHLK
jgi:hypothetical protein